MTAKSKVIIIDTLINQNLILPIKTLYFLNFALTYADISAFKSIMLFATVLLEIPSGYLADRLGNQKIGVLGLSLTTGALFMMAFLHQPGAFYLANVLLGLGSAFESGSTTSYKIEVGRVAGFKYADLFVKITKYGSLLNFGLLMLAPILFESYQTLPFLLTALMYLIGTICLATLPTVDRKNVDLKVAGPFLKVVKEMVSNILNQHEVLLELVMTSFTIGFLISNFDFYPVFFENVKINVHFFGIIYASFMLITFLATRLFQKHDFAQTTPLLIFGTGLSFFGIQQTNVWSVALAIIVQQFAFAFLTIRFSKLIIIEAEKLTDSSTYQSLISFLVTIIRLLLSVGVSLALKYLSLALSFRIMGIILVLLMIVYQIVRGRLRVKGFF